jgi:hypothetical protein
VRYALRVIQATENDPCSLNVLHRQRNAQRVAFRQQPPISIMPVRATATVWRLHATINPGLRSKLGAGVRHAGRAVSRGGRYERSRPGTNTEG